jgi:hypothetical protein
MEEGKELIISSPATPGVMTDEESTAPVETAQVTAKGTPLKSYPTLPESGIFATLNRDFGEAITSVLHAMQKRDVPVGKVMVAVDIEAQIGSGNIEPKFSYKVGRQLVCKSECRGEIKPRGRFEWDEGKDDFVFIKDADPQVDMFDAEDEAKQEADVPAGLTSLVVRGGNAEAD